MAPDTRQVNLPFPLGVLNSPEIAGLIGYLISGGGLRYGGLVDLLNN